MRLVEYTDEKTGVKGLKTKDGVIVPPETIELWQEILVRTEQRIAESIEFEEMLNRSLERYNKTGEKTGYNNADK